MTVPGKVALAAVAAVVLAGALLFWTQLPRGSDTYLELQEIPEEGVREASLVELDRQEVDAELPGLATALDEAVATGSAEVGNDTLRREITAYLARELGHEAGIYHVAWEGSYVQVATVIIDQ